jgi:serine/threonine protein kinase
MITGSEPQDHDAQLSMVADAFHAAREKGRVDDWTLYLAAVPEHLQREALVELVIIDLEHRWREGENPCIEDYIHRFPLLGPPEAVPDPLIIEEFRCRRQAGQAVALQDIARRFPVQFPRIRSTLERLQSRTISPSFSPAPVAEQDTSTIARESDAAIATQYEMLRLLGRGASGEVWLARKKSSGIEKAIKILPYTTEHAGSRRERRALELVKNLRHPYLLATEDFWISDQRLYIVMELAEGTLRKRLQACREERLAGIPPDELLRYFEEAAEGLDFLHSQAIVHRDIKPDNILLLRGHAKVSDFGLAWQQDRMVASMYTFAGTPVYMAPEIWSQEGGPPSDQYALAITYVELRQGHPPFVSLSLQDLMVAHLEGNYQFDPLISPAEQAVLRRALARDPHQRFPSCTAFVSALAAAVSTSGTVAPPLTSPAAVPPSPTIGQDSPPTCEESASLQRPVTPPWGTSAAPPSTVQGEPTPHFTLPSAPLVHVPEGELSEVGSEVRPRLSLPTPARLALLLVGGSVAIASMLLFSSWLSFRPTDTNTLTDSGTPSANISHGLSGNILGQKTSGSSDAALVLPHPLARLAPEATIVTLADGRRVAERLVIPVQGEEGHFRLIAPAGGPSVPAPFYMLETKVWNKLYAAGGGTVPPASEVHGELAPVTHVTAWEAARFAQDVFGGRLPTPQEWDHAAGFYLVQDRTSVSRPGSRVWVAQSRPRNALADSGTSDVNELGLRDMAGNGREWTCMLLPNDPQASPQLWDLAHPPGDRDAIILRGRNFTLPTPLTFDHLRAEQLSPQRQYAGSRSPYTSFRVVIPLPTP